MSKENNQGSPKKAKLPSLTWIFSGISLLSLVFSVLFARIVTFPATNAKRTTLFIYQAISTTFNWAFVLTAGAALATIIIFANKQESSIEDVDASSKE